MAKIFKRRLTAPSYNNKYYLKKGTVFGGYNKCIQVNSFTGSCLPNCTGYAWGRFCECQGKKSCKLSTGDAGNWWYKNDGYKRGKTPKLGAVICWKDSQGAGHVAIVEKVENNGDITTSNSAWGGDRFFLNNLKKKKNYYFGSTYTFQGFIYNPTEFQDPDEPIPVVKTKKKKFNWCVFTKNIRLKRHLTVK